MEHKYNTIMLVHLEDKQFISKFLTFFEDKGFNILHVPNIEQAYQTLGSQRIDIVVLDMDQNYDSAYKFCYRVKRNENFKNIMLITLTAANERFNIFIDGRTKEERKWLNCDLLVHKPISARNLYLLLKKEIAILEGIDATELDSESTSGA